MKSTGIIAGLAIGALLLLAWTQVWVDVALTSGTAIQAAGEVAAPALAALGLAMLALSAALALAGPALRVVLGLLQVLVAGTALLAGLPSLLSPATAAAPAISDATGVAGAESVAALVATATPSIWPAATLVLGGLGVLHGVFVLVTARRWPASTRRFEAQRHAPEAPRDAIGDWDSLSGGEDPTSR